MTAAAVGSMLPTMRELNDVRDALDELLFENEGELTVDLEKAFEKIEGMIDTKLERWGLWILDRETDVVKLREEEKRIAARRKAIEHAVERSKAGLLMQMQRHERTKLSGLLITVSVATNPPSLAGELAPETLSTLFEEGAPFVKFAPATFALDRRAAIEHHKAGQPLPDGLTVTRGISLRIK